MNSLDKLLDLLDVQEVLDFSHVDAVVLFGLWRIQINSASSIEFQTISVSGTWEPHEFCECPIPLFIESNRVSLPSKHSSSLSEYMDYEHSLLRWKAKFIKCVNAKICSLYDNSSTDTRTQVVNDRILCFIQEKINKKNLECFSCSVDELHGFINSRLFTQKSFFTLFPYPPETMTISTLANAVIYAEALKIFNHYLPHHGVIGKLMTINSGLIAAIEKNNFTTKTALAKLILANIDDVANFNNNEISFFVNCDRLSLELLSNEKENFSLWLRFFSEVARNCKFSNIHLLMREFIRLGYANCFKNKKYVEATFSFFQSKSFQSNTYDLNYSLEYSLILNGITWGGAYAGSVDEYLDALEHSIDDIRKTDVFRSFMLFKQHESAYLKAGYSYNVVSSEFLNDLLVNCHILVGLGWSDTISSDMGFVLQKINNSYVLIGADSLPDRSFYHITIIGDDVDASTTGSSVDYERHYEKVLRSCVGVV